MARRLLVACWVAVCLACAPALAWANGTDATNASGAASGVSTTNASGAASVPSSGLSDAPATSSSADEATVPVGGSTSLGSTYEGWRYTPADVEIVSGDAARIEGVSFGVGAFERVAKGTQRAGQGMPLGYRVPIQRDASLVVVATSNRTLVHVDARAAGMDETQFAGNVDGQMALWSLVLALDERASAGMPSLEQAAPVPLFWTGDTFDDGTYRYRFNDQDDQGNRYVTVTPASVPEGELTQEAVEASGLDLSAGVQWVDSGRIVDTAQVANPPVPSVLDRLGTFFSGVDYRPLWVSLKTGLCALAFSGVLGLLAAWRVMGTTSRLKGLLDSVFTIPMVLPPTVCGFLLLMLFGQSSAVGRWLIDHGIEIVFSWPAAVIAAVVVSFPLVYRTALGAFEALDARMLDAARTLGWSEWRIFRFIMLPLAWPSIAAGAVLAFARAMGEFGCTLFFAGNYAGVTQTIPIAIYFEWMGGNTDVALFWVVVVILFSLAVVVGINVYTARQQRYRRGSASGTGSVAHARGGLLRRGAVRKGSGASGPRDEIDAAGGDAIRIDQDKLRALLASSDRQARKG